MNQQNPSHPRFSSILTCPTCSKFSNENFKQDVVYYHLSVCIEDDDHGHSLPFNPDAKGERLRDPGRNAFGDLYSHLLSSMVFSMKECTVEEGGVMIDWGMIDFRHKSELFPEESVIGRAFEAGGKKRVKDYIELPRFRDARSLSQIQLLLAHCIYPEDEESPSGKFFIPILLLRRSCLLIRKPPADLDYSLVMRDLGLIESRWMDNLPKSEKHSLFYLKTLCQIKLKRYKDAKVSLDESLEALEYSNVEQDLREGRRMKVKKGMEVIEKNGVKNVKAEEEIFVEPRLTKANLKYPALSNKLDVISRPVGTTSRHGIVANENIAPGEILALEKPIVSALRHDLVYVTHNHCHHCLSFTRHLFPCPTCCLVMFCSVECIDQSTSTYHKHECPLGLPLIAAALGSSFQFQVGLALRLLFSRPIKEWERQEKRGIIGSGILYDMDKHLGRDKVYSSGDWRNFWNLESQGDSTLLVHRSITMAQVHAMRLVKLSGYFEGRRAKEKEEQVVLKVLSLAIRICKFNSLGVERLSSNVVKSLEELEMLVSVTYGQGVYNTLSLFNHSCVKNAAWFNNGKNAAVVVATRRIAKGQEVFLSYFYYLLSQMTEVRLDQLCREYDFLCRCEACQGRWSMPGPGDARFSFIFNSVLFGRPICDLRRYEDSEEWLRMEVENYERVGRGLTSDKEKAILSEAGSLHFRLAMRAKYSVKLKL